MGLTVLRLDNSHLGAAPVTEIQQSGSRLLALDVPATWQAEIRFGSPTSVGIPLRTGLSLALNFDRFWIYRTSALSAPIVLLIASNTDSDADLVSGPQVPAFHDSAAGLRQVSDEYPMPVRTYGTLSGGAVQEIELLAGGGHNLLKSIAYLRGESSYDEPRSNQWATLLASAARNADTTSADQVNVNGRGMLLVFVTTVAGVGAVTPLLQTKLPDGTYATLHTFANITGTGTVRHAAYPGWSGGGSVTPVSMGLPRDWRIYMDHSDASSWTYAAYACVLL